MGKFVNQEGEPCNNSLQRVPLYTYFVMPPFTVSLADYSALAQLSVLLQIVKTLLSLDSLWAPELS